MPGIASAATAVLIGHIGAGTSTIRIGAGGIMLPNHAPLQVAEQFGTLASLFPGRVDLGLGRAPGTDHAAAFALRRTLQANPDEFPRDVMELIDYFRDAAAGPAGARGSGRRPARADLDPRLEPVRRAGRRGARPAVLVRVALRAAADARGDRRLSRALHAVGAFAAPYVMLGVNIVAADTDAEARFLASSGRQSFASLRAGRPITLPPPSKEWERDPSDRQYRSRPNQTRVSFVGAPATIADQIAGVRRSDAGRRVDRRVAHLRSRGAGCARTNSPG